MKEKGVQVRPCGGTGNDLIRYLKENNGCDIEAEDNRNWQGVGESIELNRVIIAVAVEA